MVLVVILIWIAVGLAIAMVVIRRKADAVQWQLSQEKQQLEVANAALKAEVDALTPFRAILDARAEAEQILLDARRRTDAIVQEAERARAAAEQAARDLIARAEDQSREQQTRAREEASRIRAKAGQALLDAQAQSAALMRSANTEAEAIVDKAQKRAQEIAGSAYEAVQSAERFERVAKAMKNLIDGYGDQYVIPSRSLLDDLAAEYGFTQAGQDLKEARDRTRQMVANHTAATCDYVETIRRDTAIRFVVDAFNGKVDSILSRVKDANIGTLEQEIRDAFSLVNFNGSAFRNARILDTYLAARLRELRLAATVQELKLRDREEQRRIKEQIREEERAQREFERSMREAAKEEDTLRKAMEKLQGKVAEATEAQRQKYEAQLAEFAEKLRLAEERSQRAKSMAEQTKSGHVYVISNVGSFGDDVFKIGLTRRLEPEDRVRELGDASVPFSFDIHTLIFSDNAPALEHALHKHFVTAQMNKVNPRKEFFRVPIATIRQELEVLGIQTKWTLTAEAREYRETLAIEKALKENPQRGREWVAQQQHLVDTAPIADEAPETVSAAN